MTAYRQPAHLSDERAVERYAARLLEVPMAPEVLIELAERIHAHSDVDGYCSNGCNAGGWRLPYPCPTRLFYQAVCAHLSSCDAPAPATSASPPPNSACTSTQSPSLWFPS
jgi:hypothetical protein